MDFTELTRQIMDKKKSVLIITVSIVSRILILVTALIVRRLLISYIGNDVNGLNSLYTSIIGMLSVAELGIGSAIAFAMYHPIVENDQKSVAALYCLYRKLYRIIGLIIFCLGLVILPFLPGLISDYNDLSVNVYLTFFLSLVSVVLTYFYGAKTSLIEAYKDNDLTTGIHAISRLLTYALQAAAILIWRSFTVFLICQIIETLLIWLLTDLAVRRKHRDVISLHETVDAGKMAEVTKSIRAMVMHKISNMLVNTVDSVIISAFIGVVVLGKYSNYTLIVGVISGIISLFFYPLTSVVGHLCAEGDKYKIKRHFDYFYCMNYFLGVIFFLGYYAVVDYAIRLCFGSGLEMPRSIAFIITLDQFTKCMRNTQLLFRNASSTFYYDRWKAIIEGICNLVLSLLFVQVFPEEYRVVGVLVATIITTLFICDIVDPYVVFVHVFGIKPWRFCLKNYCYIALFTLALLTSSRLLHPAASILSGILINGFISLGVALIVLSFVFIIDPSFRNGVLIMCRSIFTWMRKREIPEK